MKHVWNSLNKVKVVGAWLFEHAGDPRVKNIAILLLALLSAFGMVAPETATNLRDAVLSFAL